MILGFLAATALVAQSAPPAVNKYAIDEPMARPPRARLVWRDEFGGNRLDRSKWDYDTAYNKKGWFNGERQYYSAGRPENIRVAGGRLILAARRERLDPKLYPDWGGQDYTSAKVVARGKAQWTYGYYKIRAKLPCARGTWPAIWMLPTHMVKWPDEGEIDIMEQVGSEPNLIYASLHTQIFNHVQKTQRSVQKLLPASCTSFHTYQLDWRPDSITIGFDGRAYMRVHNDQPGGKGAWPFDTPFYMILNLAMGGPWAAAKGMDDAALPQRMEVDYVRVWQRR
jgi:beta-glucanase (GH16 family)